MSTERDQFEAWWASSGFTKFSETGFAAWQAGRAALLAELAQVPAVAWSIVGGRRVILPKIKAIATLRDDAHLFSVPLIARPDPNKET